MAYPRPTQRPCARQALGVTVGRAGSSCLSTEIVQDIYNCQYRSRLFYVALNAGGGDQRIWWPPRSLPRRCVLITVWLVAVAKAREATGWAAEGC